MKEIKFRGQRVDNKQWVHGFYFKTPLTDEATNSKPEDGWSFLSGRERHCISQGSCVYEVIPETVGQYINITDINNNEYCEGDIYKYENPNYGYGGNAKEFKYRIFENIEDLYFDDSFEWDMKHGEIIGNKFDNLEEIS